MIEKALRAARWLFLFAYRGVVRVLRWFAQLLGLTRVFGMAIGGGVGAIFGASTGVALGGTAFVGSVFLAPLLALVGFLAASIFVLALRLKKLKESSEETNVDP